MNVKDLTFTLHCIALSFLGGFVDNESGVQYHSKPSFKNED